MLYTYEFTGGELDQLTQSARSEITPQMSRYFRDAASDWSTAFGEVELFYQEPQDEASLCEVYHAMISYSAGGDTVLVFFRSPFELMGFSAKYPALRWPPKPKIIGDIAPIFYNTPETPTDAGHSKGFMSEAGRPDPDTTASPDPHAPLVPDTTGKASASSPSCQADSESPLQTETKSR